MQHDARGSAPVRLMVPVSHARVIELIESSHGCIKLSILIVSQV
jgi:hypothetical protein